MLEIEYKGERRRYVFCTVRDAVRDFRREFGLVGKRLHGQLMVWRVGQGGCGWQLVKIV